MKQIKTLEELKGKTIKRVADDDEGCIVFFFEEEYAVFESKACYNTTEYGIMEDRYSLKINHPTDATRLLAIGIINKSDKEKAWKDYSDKQALERAANERKIYEELKKKYEK